MATQLTVPVPSSRPSRSGIGRSGHLQKVVTLTFLNLFCSILAHAQFSQPLVFSSGGAVALRNDQTGALTPVSGSPFLATGQNMTLDVQGRFLFCLGNNSIRMFQITDPTTGAYQEVPHSPFASSNTSDPVFIAVEPSGQFIAVVNLTGQNPGESLVETFKIDTGNPNLPALVPVPGSAVELISTPVPGGVVQPPNVRNFLIFMGPNSLSPNLTIRSGQDFENVTIDPTSGNLLGIQNSPQAPAGRAFVMDPQGRFVILGSGNAGQEGVFELRPIVPNLQDFSVSLSSSFFPDALYIESTGTFLYATYMPDNAPAVHILAIDLVNGRITETSSSPLPGAAAVPVFNADPTGPFQYGGDSQPNLLHCFSVDPQTGYFLEVAGSPFNVPGAGSLAFSIPSGQQNTSGPSILLSTSSLSFGSIQTGSSSPSQSVSITSNGGEPLAIDSISLTGADMAEFAESDTCHAPTSLQPPNFCAVSVVFQPLTAGSKQAALSITDNAPGSPHSVQLAGAGVAPPPPAPAVTISPSSLSFPTTTQGTRSAPLSVSITNSGNATLHISTVTIGGNNPGDFSDSTSACSGAVLAPNSSCTISVTFSPSAAGERSETISIADDALGSPQIIQVSGNATPAPAPAVTISPNPLNFPATTQGTKGSTLNAVVTNAGTATLHISAVNLAGSNTADFSNSTSACVGAALAPNATCSISVTFAPLSTGPRSETISLTDDASDSPQVIQASGTANPAISLGAAPSGSTSATVSAGATAQFNLQLTPGSGFVGNVTFTCTGAPANASCQTPGSLMISGAGSVPFTVSVTTSGPAHSPFLPPMILRRPPGLPVAFWPAGLLLLLIGFLVFKRDARFRLARRPLMALASICSAAAILLGAAGCGGGSAQSVTVTAPPPPGVVTPQGTSTLTVTPSATSASGAPLQLTPIQLTLTVN